MEKTKFGTIGLVLGIAAVCSLFTLPFFIEIYPTIPIIPARYPVILGILAIILSIVDWGNKLSKVGIILGVIVLIYIIALAQLSITY